MQFDFGQNWIDFSQKALTKEGVNSAVSAFNALFKGLELKGKTFLDIGFGQGLSLMSARMAGAKIIGCDINPKCAIAFESNLKFFPDLVQNKVPLFVGSILNEEILYKLKAASPDKKGYDIVHSWGVLHHTGHMTKAFRNAISLVKPGGYFVVAIYNKHWSNLPWKWIKYIYCISPVVIKKCMIMLFYPIILLVKMLVTGTNPFKKERGMDFYHDIVDWVGGYPYEYAGKQEIEAMVEQYGLTLVSCMTASVPTGCNEFVFKRIA